MTRSEMLIGKGYSKMMGIEPFADRLLCRAKCEELRLTGLKARVSWEKVGGRTKFFVYSKGSVRAGQPAAVVEAVATPARRRRAVEKVVETEPALINKAYSDIEAPALDKKDVEMKLAKAHKAWEKDKNDHALFTALVSAKSMVEANGWY